MLTEIHIHNLITIQELHLDFHKGTTVITGETGAGKSILMDAIEIALGNRANNSIIRPGQEKAELSVCFDVNKLPLAKEWLENYDLANENNECILRRVIHQDGKSKSFINGMPTTLQPLRDLSDLLLQVHGQHEHQSLLKSDYQREMLDRHIGHQHLIDMVSHLAEERRKIMQSISELHKRLDEKNARKNFVVFQLKELEDLQLVQDEFQNLDIEHKQLAHAGELLENLNYAVSCLTENEKNNVLYTLHQVLNSLENVQQVDPKITTWIENLNSTIIQISDIENELRRYLASVDLDPARLHWVENRISCLFDVARKHKINPQELYELQHRLTNELKDLDDSDNQLASMSQKLKDIEKQYGIHAAKLSENRKKAAKKISETITNTIHQLSLPHAEFDIHLEDDATKSFSPHGLEKIIFRIKTNAGQAPQPIAKIASGGELSRIALAVHLAIASKHQTPTLLFDEIDVGIGGGTAEIVGKLLRELGNSHQVICITHQPQVAALGHHHLHVAKIQNKHSTETKVHFLKSEDKINELARMLGGVEITKTALAHAKELIEKVI